MEEDDDSSNEEILQDVESFKEELEAEKLSTLLTGEYDGSNAILTFHAGAGGTEAQDWAQMLYRMYNRWAERHDFKVSLLDYLDGDEAGLKSASMLVEGQNAYGFLKSEVWCGFPPLTHPADGIPPLRHWRLCRKLTTAWKWTSDWRM